jgi:hypothetical protein
MPYASEKQRAYLHINEPEIAAKWDAELKPKKKDIPRQKLIADNIRKVSTRSS